MNKKLIFLCLIVPISFLGFTQPKEPADYTQGVNLYKEKKYDAALPLLMKSIAQLKSSDNPDKSTLASCYNYIGLCHYSKDNYTEAITNFYKSRDLFFSIGDLESTQVLLKNITLSFDNARDGNIIIKSNVFDSSDAADIYFSVTKVNTLTDDSAIVTINEGIQDGLFIGSEGNIVSSYAVGDKPGRNANEFLGTAKIIELSNYSSKAVLYFYKKYKGVQIFPKDLLTLKAYSVIGVQKNLFYEIAKLNVLFLDNSREELISKKAILFNTDPSLETILLRLYTKEINSFYEDIKAYDTVSSFNTPYTGGRFKGYNLIETFKLT